MTIISLYPAYDKHLKQFYILLKDNEKNQIEKIYYSEENFLDIALGITNLIYKVKQNNYFRGEPLDK